MRGPSSLPAPDGVRIFSRNLRDVTASSPELLAALDGRRVTIDGGIVTCDAEGRPSFAELQKWLHMVCPRRALLAAVPVTLHVFDLLELDGKSLLRRSYVERREALGELAWRVIGCRCGSTSRE